MTRRLILSYIAVTALVLVLLEVPFGIFYGKRELERLTAGVERDASVIATLYEDDLEAGLVPGRQPADRYAQRSGARVVVVDDRGFSVVDTDHAIGRDFSTRPEIARALQGMSASGTRKSTTLHTGLLYVAVPVASSGNVHGALRLTLDTDEVDARIRRFWWGLAATAGVVLSAITIVGWLIARSVTQPLRRLGAMAERFGSGDLTVGADDVRGPPEIRSLAGTMSTMAARLASMIRRQQDFVADASHQLRTPLTALRLRLENLQAGAGDAEEAAQVELAIDETARMATLVGDLLRLARADRRDPLVEVDLAGAVADRIDTWSAVADASALSLDLRGERAHLGVWAMGGAVEQVLDNVLDNAISHSPADSTVTVTVERGSGQHRVVVADEGPGLSDEDKARATRRFWRGDQSRPGTGLGLAVVEGLLEASGGSLELRDAASGGLEVVMSFPAASSDRTTRDDAAPQADET